jgi:hypothetical protein
MIMGAVGSLPQMGRDATDPAVIDGSRAVAIESDAEAKTPDLKAVASRTMH